MPDGRVGEVISVVARCRRRAVEQKFALVEEVSRPGASVAEVADRHGMSRRLLFEWRRQVLEGTMPGVVRADASAALVRIRVVDDAPRLPCSPSSSRKAAERPGKAAAMIEVVLSNGRVLRVSDAIRPEVLGRQAAALDA